MKIKGPLMSYRAKGSFDCITFKDVNLEGNNHMTVAHLKQQKKNKKTPESNKKAFQEAVSFWKELSPKEKKQWEELDYEKPVKVTDEMWQAELSGYHKFLSLNIRRKLNKKKMVRVPNLT